MKGQRIVILGAAESGVGAAVLAKLRGYEVFVSDKGMIKDSFKSVLQQYEIPYEEGMHTVETVMAADEIIKSPGISEKAPLIQQKRAAAVFPSFQKLNSLHVLRSQLSSPLPAPTENLPPLLSSITC